MYMCLMFALLDCFLKRYLYTTEVKSVSTILKVKMNFSLQNLRNSMRSKWNIYTPVHCILNWCQLHHYYIMRKQETTFDYISTHNWQKLLLNLSDYLIWKFSQSVVTCHVCLCIVVNHSLSLYYCREHKPTFQIIYNWWLHIFPYFLKIQLQL